MSDIAQHWTFVDKEEMGIQVTKVNVLTETKVAYNVKLMIDRLSEPR